MLEFDNYGILSKKEFYDKESMNDVNFAKAITENDLSKKFIDTQKDERGFVKELTEKYGNGTLDIEKEIFIPNTEN